MFPEGIRGRTPIPIGSAGAPEPCSSLGGTHFSMLSGINPWGQTTGTFSLGYIAGFGSDDNFMILLLSFFTFQKINQFFSSYILV